jgi:hypothetical protein
MNLDLDLFDLALIFVTKTEIRSRSAQNRLATIWLQYAGPTTGLKSAEGRLYERRLLADFRLVVGPAYGSRMVANQIQIGNARGS